LAATVKSHLSISLDDVLLGGLCISAVGGIWGLFLALTDGPTIEAALSRPSAEKTQGEDG
jgi:hypothetical protein